MKKSLAFTLFFAFSQLVFGQDANFDTGLGFGFQINQFQRDFGMGLSITSPYFASNNVAVRARGHVMFHEHPQDGETVWSPYGNASLGIIGGSGIIHRFIRLYGEGGITGLFPNNNFSAKEFIFGGYGLFGFEFYLSDHANYFIEIGGIGTGATADKLPEKPIYSNGLMLSVGYRGNF